MPKADKLNAQNSMGKNESRTLLLLLVSLNNQKHRSKSLSLFGKYAERYTAPYLFYVTRLNEH